MRQMLSAVSPLVSFCGTKGSRTEELHYPSPCHQESFDCEYEGPFSCWLVVSGHSYSGPNLGVKIGRQNPLGRTPLSVNSSCGLQ